MSAGGGVIVHRAACLGQGSELSVVEADGGVVLSCGSAGTWALAQSRVVKIAQPVSPMGAWVVQQAPAGRE